MASDEKVTGIDQDKEQAQDAEERTPPPTREWVHISPFPVEHLRRKATESKK